ncbi:MAG: di-trans,poly-cis-decaprenylcistransferase [Rhodanobacteraceae bacterium]|nr:MAG: di-trans,poly-cis-decaprenylcistransferase [Rhodanobacteraceae bacterium]
MPASSHQGSNTNTAGARSGSSVATTRHPAAARASTTADHPSSAVPRHIAIVMDGNGRWARRRARPRSFGHRAGQKAVRATVKYCLQRGVDVLTLFAFSSENWKRPSVEVGALMDLFLRALDKEIDELHANAVRVRFFGNLAAFSDTLRTRMQAAAVRTAGNARLTLNVCVSYGGRWDIARAIRLAAEAATRGELDPAAITEDTVAPYFCLADVPPPDLFIRTGGEHRISNFLLWQLAYTELYFTDTLWPDVDAAELDRALADYAHRERRFGCTPTPLPRAG